MATQNNKIFTRKSTLESQNMVSKIRVNREYLMSQEIASEMNTYVSFDPFHTFNDFFDPEYDPNNNYKQKDDTPIGAPGVRSIFNKMGAVMTGTGGAMGKDLPSVDQIITGRASDIRISNNVPLMDNRENRRAIRQVSGCTIKELVEASANGELGRNTYDYSDFMYCKHLGKIPNNYLITLRRFPLPVDDYISTESTLISDKDDVITSQNCQSIGCMVTWMGTPGNDMSNILKYTYSMPFTEKTAQLRNFERDADSQGGFLPSIAAAFDPTYRKQYSQGMAGSAFQSGIGKMFLGQGQQPYNARDWNSWRDDSKIYGPIDVIKSTMTRSEEGLKFDQSITLTFDYELRAYNGINGRQAILDLLSNILNVTYTTGTFWGGGYRGAGAHQNNIFANMKIFKANGGASEFRDAMMEDISTIGDAMKSGIESNGGLWNTLKYAANQLGGMLIGGILNTLGRPVKQQLMSKLSPAPVGLWHLTIGNPHHPIMSIGNLVMGDVTVEHYGPLGLDDFPTGLKVTCQLKRGKPRDLRDIEKLYMKGNNRIYSSMGPKIFDMYTNAKEYKSKDGVNVKRVIGDADSTVPTSTGTIEIKDIDKSKRVLQKYFGHADTYSIYVAACEQENGAHKPKKSGTVAGDSTEKGGVNKIKP